VAASPSCSITPAATIPIALNRRCSYPSIVQTRDGFIHVAYSYRGRQCIKYVRFTEDWVRDQVD
jgi:predicted neuraminidase